MGRDPACWVKNIYISFSIQRNELKGIYKDFINYTLKYTLTINIRYYIYIHIHYVLEFL